MVLLKCTVPVFSAEHLLTFFLFCLHVCILHQHGACQDIVSPTIVSSPRKAQKRAHTLNTSLTDMHAGEVRQKIQSGGGGLGSACGLFHQSQRV
mmetsp:Transcript_42503/g.99756  ORF Transcript_42503/g.99756 Transcript_42503/m.99756 type:complete len:94 (-) Transcript_42503:641-922(-)